MTFFQKILNSPIVRNFGHIQMTEVEKIDRPEKYLFLAQESLAGLEWCFAFGTALGFYRDKGFIPFDTDIDIFIKGEGVDAMAVAERFGMRLIRTVMFKGAYHQVALMGEDGFIIDLCFFYRDGDHYTSFCEGGHWKDDAAVIGDFRMVETVYGDMPVPEQIETYLVSRYGDWQTPDYMKHGESRKECASS